MKYQIKYDLGNGYTCGCCSRWESETEEHDSIEEALSRVADMMAEDQGTYRCIETGAIPESPADFIIDSYGDYRPAFDSEDFETKAAALSLKVKETKKLQRQKDKDDEYKRQQKQLEARDRAEYKRLKAKYGEPPVKSKQ